MDEILSGTEMGKDHEKEVFQREKHESPNGALVSGENRTWKRPDAPLWIQHHRTHFENYLRFQPTIEKEYGRVVEDEGVARSGLNESIELSSRGAVRERKVEEACRRF